MMRERMYIIRAWSAKSKGKRGNDARAAKKFYIIDDFKNALSRVKGAAACIEAKKIHFRQFI